VDNRQLFIFALFGVVLMGMANVLIICGTCKKASPLPEMSLAKNGQDMICSVCRTAKFGPMGSVPKEKAKKEGQDQDRPVFFFRQ